MGAKRVFCQRMPPPQASTMTQAPKHLYSRKASNYADIILEFYYTKLTMYFFLKKNTVFWLRMKLNNEEGWEGRNLMGENITFRHLF